MENIRRLDDPSNYTDTLLTLPLSDFPSSSNATSSANGQHGNEVNNDEDELILIRLPPSSANSEGGITMEDLVRGQNVYILGDTSEGDIEHSFHAPLPLQDASTGSGGGDGVAVGGSIEPVAARLIVEGNGTVDGGCGKTLELTRVETSNTYIVVPPMSKTKEEEQLESSSNKRQKLDTNSNNNNNGNNNGNGDGKNKVLVAMPARSIGPVPGEDSASSTFFLDPTHLEQGHFASMLRGVLGRWMYDPFDPPSTEDEGGSGLLFGYTVSELAHVCRTSRSEIEHAVWSRQFGAEDALVIPSSSTTESRYGILSEEGRQTVSSAIVSALLESDLDLVWDLPKQTPQATTTKGVNISSLIEEIRTHWHREEGDTTNNNNTAASRSKAPQNPYLTDSQSQKETTLTEEEESQSQFGTPSQLPGMSTGVQRLADEVIWHCLRPILSYNDNNSGAGTSAKNADVIPEHAWLIPDEVAKLAAHHVFLTSAPRASTSASLALAKGGSSAVWEEEELMEAWSARLPSIPSGYEPRTELLKGVAICEELKEESVVAKEGGVGGDEQQQQQQSRRTWQYFPEASLPSVPALRIKSMFAMQDAWTLEETVPYLEKFVNGTMTEEAAKEMMEKYAKSITSKGKDDDGKDVSVVKYVTL